MSIQSEITRINNAKTAIKTSIESKGVTVPNATMLDDMPELIDQIESYKTVLSDSVPTDMNSGDIWYRIKTYDVEYRKGILSATPPKQI